MLHSTIDGALADAVDSLVLPSGANPALGPGNDEHGPGHAVVNEAPQPDSNPNMVRLDNTLRFATSGADANEQTLYVSLWLRDPGEAANYEQLAFFSAPRLGGLTAKPLRVLVDGCSLAFLDGRAVKYVGRLEPIDLTQSNDPAAPKHVVIVAIDVGPAPAQSPAANLSIRKFVSAFLEQRRKQRTVTETLPCLRGKYTDEVA